MHVASTSATLNGRRHGLNAAGALVWQRCRLHVPTLLKFWEPPLPEALSRPVQGLITFALSLVLEGETGPSPPSSTEGAKLHSTAHLYVMVPNLKEG